MKKTNNIKITDCKQNTAQHFCHLYVLHVLRTYNRWLLCLPSSEQTSY